MNRMKTEIFYLLAALALSAYAVMNTGEPVDFWGAIICANVMILHSKGTR